MPLPTRILLTVGRFCGDHKFEILGSLALVVGAAVVYSQTRSGKVTIDRVMLRVPVIGVATPDDIAPLSEVRP